MEEERSCRAKHAEGKAAQGNASSRSSQLRALHKAQKDGSNPNPNPTPDPSPCPSPNPDANPKQAQKDGSIPGVIGRLGSLGSIAPEYDVAISTACSALEHIVVDNTTTAQKCVDLMRKNNLVPLFSMKAHLPTFP